MGFALFRNWKDNNVSGIHKDEANGEILKRRLQQVIKHFPTGPWYSELLKCKFLNEDMIAVVIAIQAIAH